MFNEIKTSKCLEKTYSLLYHSNPSLISSGRYITTLRNNLNVIKNENEKTKYQYAINRYLQKHIYFLQETIINSYNKTPNTRVLTPLMAIKIKNLIHSQYAVNNERYSMVDVSNFRKLQILKHSVLLKDDLVLSLKVKSENKKYKFNTKVIMSKDNVLTYASYDLDKDYDYNLKQKITISKMGKGFKALDLTNKKQFIK